MPETWLPVGGQHLSNSSQGRDHERSSHHFKRTFETPAQPAGAKWTGTSDLVQGTIDGDNCVTTTNDNRDVTGGARDAATR